MSGNARRVTITGAGGAIGQRVVAQLAAEGMPLTLALRRAESALPAWRDMPGIRIVETGDLASCPDDALERILEGAGSIVHLAGLVPGQGEGEAAFHRVNAEVTERLCRSGQENGISTFVFLSSIAAICGHASTGKIDDSTNPAPINPYGRSKLAAESHVARLAGRGLRAISLRPPLIIGGEAGGNWRQLMRLAASGMPLPFASVRNRRSYCSMETVAAAIVRLLADDWAATLSGSYCLAEEDTLSLSEALAELRAGMGLPQRLFPVPPALFGGLAPLPGLGNRIASLTGNHIVDASRFYEHFAFRPPNSLAEAVRRSGAEFAAKGRSS